jgi:uncharacterized membrane-anchored protein
MSRLEIAQDRLEKALAELEQAADTRGAGLTRDLAVARDRCATLEDRNRDVSQKLDAAISRIRSILNNGAG